MSVTQDVLGDKLIVGIIRGIVRADELADEPSYGPEPEVDSWIRNTIAQHHSALKREVCPFVTQALELGTLFYAPVTGCQCPGDVIAVMEELITQFQALDPRDGPDAHLKTLVAIFVDVEPEEADRIVLAAHPELKNRCTDRGLMVGEFAPGYRLASTRDASVNVGDAPAPVLALRHMIHSDRRFLETDDHWLRAWASRFSHDRIPLFRPLSTKELAAVGRLAREMSIEAGNVVCRQGEVGDELFVILEGKAVVSRDGAEIAAIGPGMYVGELALLTDRPRNATVTAVTDLAVLVLGRCAFRKLVDSVPSVAHKLLAGLAERLARAEASTRC